MEPLSIFQWRPDQIRRDVQWEGYHITSYTAMPLHTQQVFVWLEVTNTSDVARPTNVGVQTNGGVIYSKSDWHTPYSPKEAPSISVTPWEGNPSPASERSNLRETHHGMLLYRSQRSKAVALHVTSQVPDAIDGGTFCFETQLEAGATFRIGYGVLIGDNPAPLLEAAALWQADPETVLSASQQDWQAELDAVFTPANTRYSGHLPRLHTRNADLRRIYHTAILGIVYHKREHPESAYGRTYTTLMPRYWVTTSFINDWSLSAYLIAMLDPECLRTHIERWLARDIYRHFGSEYVSGNNAGNWYSCNDFAMVRLISAYVRTSGNWAWLHKSIQGATVLEQACRMATHYETLDRGQGLADCGGRNNLLECVGSYLHEVASVNAGYVWALRETAALFKQSGDPETAASLMHKATALAQAIQTLYVPGAGYWHCRYPDGTLVPVRHAWDFVHTMHFLFEDLSARQHAEMMAYFQRELWTPTWMHALSPADPDADFSLRPDHQWNGSYPAWVALAASTLVMNQEWALLKTWLPGLAKSANQGPYSQAHFVEGAAPLLAGGARKAPSDWPYINGWAILAVGGFYELVLLHLFGLAFGPETLRMNPQLRPIAPDAVLENVRHQGNLYQVSAKGIVEI